MKRTMVMVVAAAAATATVLWPQSVLSHETLTTTVLYDREIVRILDKHCVMCHVENGPAFPLSTYEQTWLQGRQIRGDVIARHMPPWPAVPGYGQFANDNSLTLRETQFIVGWVEGLGPRNAGTVFTNIADAGAAQSMPMPMSMTMSGHTGHWHLGEPDLMLALPSSTIDAGQADEVKRTVIDPQLKTPRSIRGVEYMPGDRRIVRAVFLTVQETGQWIGSWTPWYGYTELPAGSAYRLAAGSHIAAEIHYRGAKEQVVDSGALGLFFADQAPHFVSDLVLEAKSGRAGSDRKSPAGVAVQRLRAETRIATDTYAWALRPEIRSGVRSIEVSARNPDGGTEILLFAKDFSTDWPTPYILTTPVLLRRGAVLSVTAYSAKVPAPGQSPGIRLTVSRY